MTIKQILDFVNFIANKEQQGQTLRPIDFNNLLSGFNVKVFNDELMGVEVMAKAQGMPMYTALYNASSLKKFRKFATLTTDALGITSLPNDYVHYTSIVGKYNGAMRPIDVISEEEMVTRRISMTEIPLTLKPACTMYGTTVRFFPNDIGHGANQAAELSYIKFPVTPNYDYCLSVDTGLEIFMPVGSFINAFNDGTQNLYLVDSTLVASNVELPIIQGYLPYTSQTVELEWEERFHMIFVKLLLDAIGVNLKDEQIRSYQQEAVAK